MESLICNSTVMSVLSCIFILDPGQFISRPWLSIQGVGGRVLNFYRGNKTPSPSSLPPLFPHFLPFVLEANQQAEIHQTSSLPSPKRCSKKVWQLWNHSSVQTLTVVLLDMFTCDVMFWVCFVCSKSVSNLGVEKQNAFAPYVQRATQTKTSRQVSVVSPGVARLQVAKQ